jgi:radical SAM protein with 4Fe4S-binding SPASM domain
MNAPLRVLPADLRLVFWETTAGCNLECIHCRRLEVSRARMREDLTTQEAFGLVDQIAEIGRPILVLSGGEPLMRPDVWQVAERAIARGQAVSLATNGTMVDDGVAERIARVGIRRVAVSVDGADERTHDEFRRQPGSWAAALAGARRARARGVSLQVNVTITRHNRHQCDDLYRLALDLGADALHIFMLVPVGCGASISNTHMLAAEEYEEVLAWALARAREGRIHVKPTCAPHYFRIRLQRAERIGGNGSPFHALTRGCLAGTGIVFISHKGEVFPCGYLPVRCGSVRERPLGEIWRDSETLALLRRPDLLRGKCGACEFKMVCLGCRARAYFRTGNILDEEPYCSYVPVRNRVSIGQEVKPCSPRS